MALQKNPVKKSLSLFKLVSLAIFCQLKVYFPILLMLAGVTAYDGHSSWFCWPYTCHFQLPYEHNAPTTAVQSHRVGHAGVTSF